MSAGFRSGPAHDTTPGQEGAGLLRCGAVDRHIRYWTGLRWSDSTAPAGPQLPPEAQNRLAGGVPRSQVARVALTVTTVVTAILATTAATRLGLTALSLPPRGMLADWVQLGLMALIMWAPATRVGYRRRDILLLLIPFFGLYLTARICWRLCYLPFADWLPRPEDAVNWRQVPHPTRPGELLFARI
jgi:hypothetical protein